MVRLLFCELSVSLAMEANVEAVLSYSWRTVLFRFSTENVLSTDAVDMGIVSANKPMCTAAAGSHSDFLTKIYILKEIEKNNGTFPLELSHGIPYSQFCFFRNISNSIR